MAVQTIHCSLKPQIRQNVRDFNAIDLIINNIAPVPGILTLKGFYIACSFTALDESFDKYS